MLTSIVLHFTLLTGMNFCTAALTPAVDNSDPFLAAAQDEPPGRRDRGGTVRRQQEDTDAEPARNNNMPVQPSRLVNPPEVRRIVVQHMHARTLASMINQGLRENYVVSDDVSNSIIYMGPPGLAEHVVGMASKIDVPGNEAKSSQDVVVHMLRHRFPNELVQSLNMTLGRSELRVAADMSSSAIVLSGPKSEIDAAVATIEALDQMSPPAQLEFSFFGASSKKPEGDSDRDTLEMPEDLKKVASEISRFGRIEFLGRLTATATQSESFVITGGMGRRVHVEINGEVVACPTDGPVKLKIRSKMMLSDAGEKPGPVFNLETSIAAKRGDYVVIGSAPAGWEPGESAILVLHARP